MKEQKILFVSGDSVIMWGELHTVLLVIPPNRKPIDFEKDIDEMFKKHTPLMNPKYNLRYQMGGTSLFFMPTMNEITYIVASEPKRDIIFVRRATEKDLKITKRNVNDTSV